MSTFGCCFRLLRQGLLACVISVDMPWTPEKGGDGAAEAFEPIAAHES